MVKDWGGGGHFHFSVPPTPCPPSNSVGMWTMPDSGGRGGPSSPTQIRLPRALTVKFPRRLSVPKGAMELPAPQPTDVTSSMSHFQQRQPNANRGHSFRLGPIVSGKPED